jgi:hypothetical protein
LKSGCANWSALGHKTIEVEVLKETLDLVQEKTDLAALAVSGGYPVKTVTSSTIAMEIMIKSLQCGKCNSLAPDTSPPGSAPPIWS